MQRIKKQRIKEEFRDKFVNYYTLYYIPDIEIKNPLSEEFKII